MRGKMKKGLTELVFILDKSGSMGGLESDTIGGYNALLKKQKKVEGECRITTVLFDNDYELLHDRIDLRAVSLLTEDDYFVGGSTALLDAVGKTIYKIENAWKRTAEEYQPEKIMFVIITDGFENASREYTAKQVKKQVNRKKEDGWEFIFLGANIDAVEAAGQVGIHADRAVNYIADAKGTNLNFEVMGAVVEGFRQNRGISEKYLNKIRSDTKKRSAAGRNTENNLQKQTKFKNKARSKSVSANVKKLEKIKENRKSIYVKKQKKEKDQTSISEDIKKSKQEDLDTGKTEKKKTMVSISTDIIKSGQIKNNIGTKKHGKKYLLWGFTGKKKQ